jgi:hypothetical protein
LTFDRSCATPPSCGQLARRSVASHRADDLCRAHYLREQADRRVFALRDRACLAMILTRGNLTTRTELKQQFKATQKGVFGLCRARMPCTHPPQAQVAERQASESKRRFVRCVNVNGRLSDSN